MRLPRPRAHMRQYLWRVVEVVCLLVLVIILGALFVWTLKYTLPFVMGGFLALLLLPIVKVLEHQGLRRHTSVLTVVITMVVIVVTISVYVLAAVTREAVMWYATIQNSFGAIQNWLSSKIGQGQTAFGKLPPDVASRIRGTMTGTLQTAQNAFTTITQHVIKAVTHTPESLFVIVIAVLTTYFVLLNRTRMYHRFLQLLPPGWEPKVRLVTRDMLRAFGGTIRVQVVLMLMSAFLGVIGLLIMHIHYAVILGLMFGLTGMIPIVGSAILTVPWAAGALLIGDTSVALKVLLLQVVISLIRHLVEPKILAESVGLDTLSTLFGLYVGMKLMGVVGLFLGPIILIGIKSLLRIRLFIDFMPTEESDAARVRSLPMSDIARGGVRFRFPGHSRHLHERRHPKRVRPDGSPDLKSSRPPARGMRDGASADGSASSDVPGTE